MWFVKPLGGNLDTDFDFAYNFGTTLRKKNRQRSKIIRMKQVRQQEKMRPAEKGWGAYLFYYTLLFAIVSFGIFIWFIIENRSFCWTADSSPQYVPKVIYFIREGRAFLHNLLQGEWNFKMYDFQFGLGDAVPLHMEPIYWLYLLFGESRIELAYGALILLRYYLSGLSISVFLKYFHYTDWGCLAGSMVYVFSGYGLFAGMQHSHFIIPMITLPLLLLAMEEIYREKRWYLCTMFVALSFWCGYYFTYMNTILMGCYFLIRFFFGEEERSWKRFFLRMRTIICSYLLGIGIANITFFNTFAGYLTSSRTGGGAIQRVSLWSYGSGFFKSAFQCFLVTGTGPGNWLRLGFIALSYLALVLLFLRKGNLQIKAGFLLGTLFCMIPVFGYVFSGFGTITNRWCYGYAFVIALITAKMAEEFKDLTRKELIFMGILILPYLYFGIGRKLLGRGYKRATLVAGILLLLTYLLVVLVNCRKKLPGKLKTAAFTCNLIVLLWASGLMFFHSGFGNMISEFTKSGTVIDKATDTPLKVMDEVEDESFYRSYARQKSSTQGASMILEYNGVEYFNSTLAGPTVDFYREMGLTSWTLVKLMGFDERGYLDALGDVKYMVMKEGKEFPLPYGFTEVKKILRDDVYYTVYENQNVLPLGYTYDQVISLENLEKTDTPLRQEILLQAAVVDKPEEVSGCQIMEEADSEDQIRISGQKVEITDIECDENVTYDGSTIKGETDGTMILYFDGLEDSETYLYIRGLTMKKPRKGTLYFQTNEQEETQSYVVKGLTNTYNTQQEEFVINLGYTKEKKQFCKIRFGQKMTLNLEDLAIYCQPMAPLTEYAEARKADSLENIEMDTNRISGTVNAQKEELMVFSIPYQSGWSAYVDGVKTDVIRANIMYMGVGLTEGEHTIELRYEMPGLRISLVITTVSLLIFAGAMFLRRRHSMVNK